MRGKIKYAALVLAILVGSLLSWRVRADNPHGPTVVASLSESSISAGVAQTTLWTPTVDGFYDVRSYVAIHSGSCTVLTDHYYWTDTVGTNHNYTGVAGQGPAGAISIYATANNAIQVHRKLHL